MKQELHFNPDERRREKQEARERDSLRMRQAGESRCGLFEENSFIVPAPGKKGKILQSRVRIRL